MSKTIRSWRDYDDNMIDFVVVRENRKDKAFRRNQRRQRLQDKEFELI